ncbi:multicopper oxidase family protein [Cupriavidus sp. CuC1]|uniref:multicopper oxidase family protein n=1 Tax=Cupriavidus sp. CuC1 TaxID=3373131 RepID=UPI0037CF97BE
MGFATTGACLLPAQPGAAAVAANVASSDVRSPPTTPFVVPLPVFAPKATTTLDPAPGINAGVGEVGRVAHQRWNEFLPRKFYALHVQEALHSFHPELPTQPIWGYDGKVPGPTFVARYGEPVLVRIYNDLPLDHVGFGMPEISTHLHNGHIASESDGFPGDWYSVAKVDPRGFLTHPGRYKDHHYPNMFAGGDPREALGTLWYHDHRIDFTSQNVYKGLAGFYLLFDDIDSGDEHDPNPNALRLPSGVGVYDIPLVFQDKQFDSSGFLFFDQFNTDGILGDKFCVNGKVQPFFAVERRKYRFRLLDGGPSRFYEFFLSYKGVDQAFTYIANDGNLLSAPLSMKSVRLGVAERADIVIDFSQYPQGSQLYLVNRLEQVNGRGPTGNLLSPGTQILRFDVGGDPAHPDMSVVPKKLREQPPIDLAQVVKTRTIKLDRSNGQWTVNGGIFDPEQPSASPRQGTAEIWVIQPNGDWSHPFHLHLEEGRILSRNGKPPPPHERGRKDMYVVGPGEELRLFIQFRDFLGRYPAHCHNLLHEDHAMMLRFDVVR